MKRIAVSCLAFFIAATPGLAVELDREIDFNIPAQKLDLALVEFSRQAKLQVITSGADIQNLETEGATGRYTISRALLILLRSSGLSFKAVGDSAVSIGRFNSAHSESTTATTVAEGTSGHTRLAQAETQSGAATPASRRSEARAIDQDRVAIDEIVVVGSRLGASTTESAQPITVITRTEIERSGSSNVAQVLNTLSQVSINSSGTAGQSVYGTNTVQLRGLPTGNTLVLLNGRRAGGSAFIGGASYLDLNNIPIDVVEQVEVLTAGSSAVYGGDALGGVVNIKLRNPTGFSANVRYGSADGYDETQANTSWGEVWSRGALAMTASYSTNNELRGAERDITSSDDGRPYGARDRRSTASSPANIFSLTTANLPGLNSTFASVPAGSTGTGLTPGDFAATAGLLNMTSPSRDTAMIPPQERYGALITGNYELTERTSLFTELLYTESEVTRASPPLALTGMTVPASNAFNPFGDSVRADFLLGPRDIVDYSSDFSRALVGARGSVATWDWEAAAWRVDSKEHLAFQAGEIDTTALFNALASTDPETALNPFRDGPAGSNALLSSIFRATMSDYRLTLEAVDAFTKGPVFDLPAGTVDALIGAEVEHEQLVVPAGLLANPSNPQSAEATRNVRNAFAEIRVPIWSKTERSAVADGILFTGAARYDHSSDFGGETSFALGLEYRPAPALLLRAAHNTAFKAPLLLHLYGPNVTARVRITDPLLNSTYTVSRISGGNPDLQPQTGRSTVFGFVLSPSTIPGLNFSASHWEMRLENGFTTPDNQYVVDNEALYPGRVVRDPATGQILSINTTRINYGFIDVAGFDLSLSWRNDTRLGAFSPSLSASNTYNYEVQSVTNGPTTNNVAVANATGFAPRWKGTASLAWSTRHLETALSARYVSAYRDYAALLDGTFRELGDKWTVDANLRIDLGQLLTPANRYFAETALTFGVVNLLDEQPEYSSGSAFNYDPRQADLRGRFVYGHVGLKF